MKVLLNDLKQKVEKMVTTHHKELAHINTKYEKEIQAQNATWLKERQVNKTNALKTQNEIATTNHTILMLQGNIDTLKHEQTMQMEQLHAKHQLKISNLQHNHSMKLKALTL